MSQVFEGYERLYCELSANISQKREAADVLRGEQKKEKVSEIKAAFDEADMLIRKMDLESRSLQPSLKATLLAKLKEYKTDLNHLKNEIKMTANLSSRDELLEIETGTAAASLVQSNDQKGRLLASTERINQSTDRMKESRRTLLETEDLGASILQDLNQQRQSLLHAHGTLTGVDDNITRSKKTLSMISRRMNRNRLIIGSLSIVLVIGILIILFVKLTN